MFLSRSKASAPTKGPAGSEGSPAGKAIVPEFDEFLKLRDFRGAIALLEHQKSVGHESLVDDLWLAYCHFHLGEFQQAISRYESLLGKKLLPQTRRQSTQDAAGKGADKGKRQLLANVFKSKKQSASVDKSEMQLLAENYSQEDLMLYISCCLFFLGRDEEALEMIKQTALKSPLRNRLELLIMTKRGEQVDAKSLLGSDIQDQMCLAAVHYLSMRYQEAIEIYKKILIENRDLIAVNVYIALCYYKLDYYDVSQEILGIYLKQHPDSAVATNLKACNHYRLYNGKAAESELRSLIDNSSACEFAKELIRHNLVVFRAGEGALQVFPSLLGVLPEARLNLVIYHLRHDETGKAFAFVKDTTPLQTNEFIISAVVHAIVGQEESNREQLKTAQKYFQVVGGSPSECDTIPGRQCMASCFFLMKQFDDVILYLSSIKSYFYNDDAFNFNYGQVKGATGKYREALECLLQVQDEKTCNSSVFLLWIVRCNIMRRKAESAWQVYQEIKSAPLAFQILTLIANDCYRVGLFLDAMKAFDMLDKLDQNPEYWEAKRGAAAGHFQMVIAKKEPIQSLDEVLNLLRFSPHAQAEQISNVIKKWIKSQDE